MKRFLALLALAAGLHAATTDTTWRYTPYSNEVTDLKFFRGSGSPILWIGTSHGVVRVRGADTIWIHPSNSSLPAEIVSPQSPSNQTLAYTSTALDSSGNYWIAYRLLDQVARIDTNGTVTVIGSGTGHAWSAPASISASKSRIYVANTEGSVFFAPESSIEESSWSLLAGTGSTGSSSILLRSLAAGWGDTLLWLGYEGDANGNLKYCLASGCSYFQDGEGNKVTGSIWNIWSDSSNGARWLRVVSQGGYGSLSSDTLFLVSAYNRNGTIAAMAKGKGGKGQFTGFFDPTAGTFQFLKADSLWYMSATMGYVSLYLDRTFSGRGLVAGASFGSESGDSLWLGGTSSLYYRGLLDGVDTVVARPYGFALTGNGVIAAASGSEGRLWIATDSTVYYRSDLDSTLVRNYTPGDRILAMAADTSDVLWIGRENGLVKWIDGAVSEIAAIQDSVLAIASSGPRLWVLHGTSGHLKLNYLQGSLWTQVALTGLGDDSSSITRMRALEDGGLWVLAAGGIYDLYDATWSDWTAIDPTVGTGPGTGNFYDFDIASSRLWTLFQTTSQYNSWSWGVATPSGSEALASGTMVSSAGGILAEDADTTAWYFVSSREATYTGEPLSDSLFHAGLSGFTLRLGSGKSGEGPLHKGTLAEDGLLSDGAGGLWLVMTDGLQRMAVAEVAVSDTDTIASSLSARSLSSLAWNGQGLSLDLATPAAISIEVFDFGGRRLALRDLGRLEAGAHSIALPSNGRGLRLVRVTVDGQSRTLRMPSL